MATKFEELVNQTMSQIGSASASVSRNDPDDPMVFTGSTAASTRAKFVRTNPNAGKGVLTEKGKLAQNSSEERPLSDVVADFYRWDDKERQEWGKHLVDLGIIAPEDNTYANQLDLWKEMAQEAASYRSVNKRITPREAARLFAGQGGLAGKGVQGPKKYGDSRDDDFTGTESQTDTKFDLTDPSTVKGATNRLFQQMMGRDANPEEIQQFVASLQAAERANPVQQTTETQYQNGMPTGQTVTASGGVDRTQVLQDQTRAMPGYGEYQAATTYFNALIGSIGSPV